VAHEFGIPLEKITIKPSNNLIGANSDCTGGAITSELASYATIKACQQIKERMERVKKGLDNPSWEELVSQCQKAAIDMRGTYMYTPNDEDVKPYDIYGCNLTEVEVDVLTGEFKIVRLDIIEDAGKSLSPEIDIGQIEGSLVMGLGLWTEEKVVFDPESGRLLTKNTWEYKVPFPKCIPEELNIVIMKNAPNPFGVLRSKATGEPPLCLSVAALFAIKNAIKAARKDAGNTDWFPLDGPVTPEVVVNLSLTNPQAHFLF
jgi:xanthine dehydrogenase/oxidase